MRRCDPTRPRAIQDGPTDSVRHLFLRSLAALAKRTVCRHADTDDIALAWHADCVNGMGCTADTGEPVYKFGDGMSYTSFEYSLVTPREALIDAAALRQYATAATERHVFLRETALATSNAARHTAVVTVTNTGQVAGAHTVLAMLSPPQPGVVRSVTRY